MDPLFSCDQVLPYKVQGRSSSIQEELLSDFFVHLDFYQCCIQQEDEEEQKYFIDYLCGVID